MGRLSRALTELPVARPRAALGVALLVAALSVVALARLELIADPAEALDTPVARTTSRIAATFELTERLHVLLEVPARVDQRGGEGADERGLGAEATLLRYARALSTRLRDAEPVTAVDFGAEAAGAAALASAVPSLGPFYAEGDELDRVERVLTPDGMRAQLELQASRLALLGLGDADRWSERDPLDLHRPLVRRLRALSGGTRMAEGSPYRLSPDRRALLVEVRGRRGLSGVGEAQRLVAAVRGATEALQAEPWARDVQVQLAGGPVLATESEQVIRRDLTLGLGVSSLVAVGLMAYGLRLPLWAMFVCLLPTAWGLLVGGGLYALLRPQLALLSLGTAAVLVGLGVDFTIHLVAAARAAQRDGLDPVAAALAGARVTRGALVLAASTSVAAFLAFQTARQEVLADMGLLTACGLIGCLLGALTLLPAILPRVLAPPNAADLGADPGADPAAADPAAQAERAGTPTRTFGAAGLARWAEGRPRAVLLATAAVSLVATLALLRTPPRLEGDLRLLQPRDSAAVAAQERIEEVFGGARHALLVLLEGPSEAAVVDASRRLEGPLRAMRREGLLAGHTSPAGILPDPEAEAAAIERLARVAGDGRPGVATSLARALDDVGFEPEAFAEYGRALEAALARRAPVDLDDLRAAGLGPLVERFVRRGEHGARALILVTPATSVWAAEERERVTAGLQRALSAVGAAADATGVSDPADDPTPPDAAASGAGSAGPASRVRARLGGLPLLTAEVLDLLAADFRRVALLTAAGVLLVLCLRFRRPLPVALALLPAALGTLWTASLLGASGWGLNLMNLGVLPMVLALGVDDGIHVVHHRLRAARVRTTREAGDATMLGVALTTLTTLVAFGSLVLSDNPGLASVGALTVFGLASALLASLVTLPAALSLAVARLDVGSSAEPGAAAPGEEEPQ